MSVKVAVLGASYLQRPLYEKLRELGIFSIGISWNKEEDCVKEGLADKFYEISIVEKERVLNVCKKENIHGIVSIASDVAVPVMAYVCSKMNLIGNSIESGMWSTNKVEMRKRFQLHNLPIPLFKEIKAVDDVITFINDVDSDLILKPADRSGSMGVQRLNKKNSKDQISEWTKYALESSFSKTAIIEQFIEGREISVEYISNNGTHFFLNTTDKVTSGSPHYVEIEQHQPAVLSESLLKNIKELVPKALNSLGIMFGASHTELLIDSDDNIWITEIGARMGGDFIGSTLTKLSTGYDFVEGVINCALGKFSTPVLENEFHSGIFFYCEETQYVKKYLEEDDHKEIVEKKMLNNELKKLTKSSDRSGYFIYQSKKRFQIE